MEAILWNREPHLLSSCQYESRIISVIDLNELGWRCIGVLVLWGKLLYNMALSDPQEEKKATQMRVVLFQSDIFKSLNIEHFVLFDTEQTSILWTTAWFLVVHYVPF